MADEKVTLSGINWRETFAFTHLFRSFRVAIHPSKLILGLLLLLALYLGGRLLDRIWPTRHLAVPGEVAQFARGSGDAESRRAFADFREQQRQRAVAQYEELLFRYQVFNRQDEADRKAAAAAAASGAKHGELEDKIKENLRKDIERHAFARDEALKAADEKEGEEEERAEEAAEAAYREAVARSYAAARADLNAASAVRGRGIFITFFDYEVGQIDRLVTNVLNWNWGIDTGILGNVYNFVVTGPSWLLRAHPVYFFIFLLYFLAVWSIFGGAIARIAAVHVARDEKISIRAALKFSATKFLSFFFAPLIPLLIILGIGLVVFLGGLVGNIPFIGPILVGLLFFLALAAGIVMTLVLLGLIGGFNLMYPTIAVEGSDSFDAISRSFSYLYARPWKMAFYTALSVVYGALTFLFVRFFIFLTLLLTHRFVNCGMFKTAYNGNESWLEMWPLGISPTAGDDATTFWSLPYNINFLALGPGEATGAWLVALWNYLLIGMLGAFAIAFYFAANTIIYYLMRREVDATEMDDVYVEQLDEEFTETPPAPPAETPAAPAAPAESKPAESKPADSSPAGGTTTGDAAAGTSAPPAEPPASQPPADQPPADQSQTPQPPAEQPPASGEQSPEGDRPNPPLP